MSQCTVEVNEDGDYYIIIPDELIEELGWKINDLIEWTIEGDRIVLSRKEVTKDESDSSN